MWFAKVGGYWERRTEVVDAVEGVDVGNADEDGDRGTVQSMGLVCVVEWRVLKAIVHTRKPYPTVQRQQILHHVSC